MRAVVNQSMWGEAAYFAIIVAAAYRSMFALTPRMVTLAVHCTLRWSRHRLQSMSVASVQKQGVARSLAITTKALAQ